MSLTPGTRLGSYEVIAQIGAGGMGEVYRARDLRLNRDVAIKVLPEIVAADSERLARFHREAQLLASLNHPNVAHVYGVEDASSLHALVMELVEGPTLADHIARGPIPLRDALAIAKQIVDALEAAHEQGVIHRDLKPANIKVRDDNVVKLLDFGLAKLIDPTTAPNANLSMSPTLTRATMAGVILGTAAYMSPEQARGRDVDKRADIWAFGCVLFEMLTGRPAFGGETVTDILASVIQKDPAWETLPATPVAVTQLLRRCLTRDPVRRLRDIGDARFDLDGALHAEPHAAAAEHRSGRTLLWSAFAFVAGTAVAGIVIWVLLNRAPPPNAAVGRWTISLPSDAPVDVRGPWSSMAISRDGRAILYVAQTHDGRELFVRRAEDFTPRRISGTLDVWEAFFSPDGQWIGFITADRLKKVAITGGQPSTIADTPNFSSGVWSDDGMIYLGGRAGLAKVSPDGRLTQLLNPLADEGRLIHPDLLPDGSLLFTIQPNNVSSFDDARLAVLTPKGERRVVLEGGAFARYASSGDIVYVHGGQIMAVPFDLGRLAISGEPAPVVAGGSFDPASGAAFFALSRNGVLAYVPGGPLIKQRSLAWIDRHGTLTPIPAPPRFYAEPRISPDGKQIAFTIRAANDDVWTYDIARNAFTRLTFPRGNSEVPLFSPDGRRVVYAADREGVRSLVWRAADGSGGEEPLTPAEYFQTPGSWSPDGKLLAYTEDRPDTGSDIMLLSVNGHEKPIRFLATPIHERSPMFSPDGKWIAYMSDETGQFEIFVTPYPGPGRKWQVSQGGGSSPAWRGDGREIIYQNNDRMMSVAIQAGPQIESASPTELFKLPPNVDYTAMSSDAQRFLAIVGDGHDQNVHELEVVVNWLDELKRRVSTK